MSLKVPSSPKSSVILGVCEALGSHLVLGSCQKILLSKPMGKTRGPHPVASCVLPQEKCAQYWPSDGSVSYGDITVELKKEEECESYTVRDLLVTNTRVRACLLPLGVSVLLGFIAMSLCWCSLSSMGSPLSQRDFIPVPLLIPCPSPVFCCPHHQASPLLCALGMPLLHGLLSQSPEPVGSLVLPDPELCPPDRKTRADRSGSSTSTAGQKLGSPGMARG